MPKMMIDDLKKELKENDRIWAYLELIAFPGIVFKDFSEDWDDALNTLTNAEMENPRLLLWINAFYQTGRDVDWHFPGIPKGGPLEQLSVYMDLDQDLKGLRQYLAGKSNLRFYIRYTYKWFYHLRYGKC